MPQEAGFSGTLVSLGGVSGVRYRGRQTTGEVITVEAATPNTLLLASNPRRLAAIVQNIGAANIALTFGAEGVGNEGLTLAPGVSFQIDYNFPWTGDVRGVANTVKAWVQEVNVP